MVKKSKKKKGKKIYISPFKALEDTIMSAGRNKVITKDDINTILQEAKELDIEEDRAKECINSAIKKYGWAQEEKPKGLINIIGKTFISIIIKLFSYFLQFVLLIFGLTFVAFIISLLLDLYHKIMG